MARFRRPAVLFVVAAILLVFGLVGKLFFDDEPNRLLTEDKLGDCREAGRDTGERCDVGADIESVSLSVDGERLFVDFGSSTRPPSPTPSRGRSSSSPTPRIPSSVV